MCETRGDFFFSRINFFSGGKYFIFFPAEHFYPCEFIEFIVCFSTGKFLFSMSETK